MTHTNDHDFQQFRGAFDDAMTPDAVFRAKMEKLLQSEKPVEQERTPTVLASPPKPSAPTAIPARRSHPLMIAAAVLTVFAVVVASVWVLSGDVLEGEYANAPGAIATIPADVPLAPGADVQLTGERFPGAASEQWLHGVEDGVIISSHYESNRGPDTPVTLAAVDANSGEVRWEIPDMDLAQVTIKDDVVIGVEYRWESTDPWTNASLFLTAINLNTGDLLWKTQISAPGDDFDRVPYSTPVRVGDNVVIVQANGNIQAWNANSGDLEWNHDFDPGKNLPLQLSQDPGEAIHEVIWIPVDALEWNNRLVIVTGAGEVLVIDENGNETASWSVAPLEDESSIVTRLEMMPVADQALVVRDSQTYEGKTHSVFAFDPGTGEVSWTQNTEGQAHIDISDDGTVAMNTHVWKQYPDFLRFFGLVGYSTFQFTWLDGKTGDVILETERGKLEAPAVTLTDGKYACTRTGKTEIICFDRAGTRHILEAEPQGDLLITDGVLYVPTQDGWLKVNLP